MERVSKLGSSIVALVTTLLLRDKYTNIYWIYSTGVMPLGHFCSISSQYRHQRDFYFIKANVSVLVWSLFGTMSFFSGAISSLSVRSVCSDQSSPVSSYFYSIWCYTAWNLGFAGLTDGPKKSLGELLRLFPLMVTCYSYKSYKILKNPQK